MSFSIDQLIADCIEAVEDTDGHEGVGVKEVLARTISSPAAIEAAIGLPSDLPLFTTWFNDERLTILHVVWPPTVDLMPHDHLMWAAIGLYGGREDNQVFRALPDGSLESRRATTLLGGDTITLGDDAIHAVANPSREWTGAIHAYGGNYFRDGKHMWDGPQGPAKPFEIDRLREVLDDAATRARAEDRS